MLEENKQKPQKATVIAYLTNLRLQFIAQVAEGQDPDKVSSDLGQLILQGSVETSKAAMKIIKSGNLLQIAANGGTAGMFIFRSIGPGQLLFASTVFTAQTGINFRKYKKGIISKKEFKKRTKKNGIRQTGSVVGSTTGVIAGFFIGQILIPFPVVGGVIGTIVGGTVGGVLGARAANKLYQRVEYQIHERRDNILEAARK